MSRAEERRILGHWGKYTVRRFRPSHAAEIQQREYDAKADEAIAGRMIGLTIFKGKDIVACMGIRPLWRGVGEGWVLTSPLVEECPKFLTAVTLRGLLWLERNQGYHRIGAHVLVSFTAAHKWAERLGFKIEGPAPGYGPNGEDFVHYGRVHK